MRPPKVIPEADLPRLERLMRQAHSAIVLRRIQCVYLRAKLRLAPAEIAAATGYKKNTVQLIQSAYLRRGEQAFEGPGRGGRRRQNLTPQQEVALLEPFLQTARAGGVLEAGPVKAAYERTVGRKVHKTTVYRLLARHGWRKLVPRSRHPDGDAQAREAWKKNSPTCSPSTSDEPKRKNVRRA
jgi:transposase